MLPHGSPRHSLALFVRFGMAFSLPSCFGRWLQHYSSTCSLLPRVRPGSSLGGLARDSNTRVELTADLGSRSA
eukprot:1200016-Rhodomonas_salina.1